MIINCKKRFCRFLIFSFSKNFAPVDYWGYRNPSLNFFELWLDLKQKLHGLKPWKKEEFIWGYHFVSKTLLCWKFKFDMLGCSRHPSVNKDLTFEFLTTSGTNNFAYGSLILLQLPLHLLILILKGKNIGSSLLTITICDLTLNSWLFIEIHFNEFILGKLQPKKIIAEINISFTNPNILLYYVIFFIK